MKQRAGPGPRLAPDPGPGVSDPGPFREASKRGPGRPPGPRPYTRYEVSCVCRPDGPWIVLAPAFELYPCVRCGSIMRVSPVGAIRR